MGAWLAPGARGAGAAGATGGRAEPGAGTAGAPGLGGDDDAPLGRGLFVDVVVVVGDFDS
ncbi:hypothetical protein [Mycobacterium branderi]|uniref:hypothetical protein n=1 Tax=Mycobacterium branderi TaxID=43348 RepID=UPI00111BD4D7|nr:hypothetical protein [Mycobacterium branderi]MCV7233782.1 hypothetical protein [Mycobacterium branderi]